MTIFIDRCNCFLIISLLISRLQGLQSVILSGPYMFLCSWEKHWPAITFFINVDGPYKTLRGYVFE